MSKVFQKYNCSPKGTLPQLLCTDLRQRKSKHHSMTVLCHLVAVEWNDPKRSAKSTDESHKPQQSLTQWCSEAHYQWTVKAGILKKQIRGGRISLKHHRYEWNALKLLNWLSLSSYPAVIRYRRTAVIRSANPFNCMLTPMPIISRCHACLWWSSNGETSSSFG